jgi:hypothetical protein
MERAGFSRLTEATAALEAPDRALLNLWINRGLDDPALAEMTGMTPEAVAARRGRIVQRLSDELSLPADEVAEALGQIAASSPRADTRRNGDAPAAPGQVSADPSQPSPGERRSRPFPLSAALGVAALMIIGVVVGLALAVDGSGTHNRPTSAAAPTSTAAVTAAAIPATSSSPAPPLSPPQRRPRRLSLPRGVGRARGAVFLAGNGGHLRLKLTVRALPTARRGHFEVWLYNSVRDSRALGRLRTGRHHVTLRLPRGARRYRWIDISFQPLGFVHHSGLSVLRAADPDRASRRELKRRGGRRRPLRRATTVAATARHRHARSAHRRHLRRATRGSAKAKRSK